MIKIVGQGVAIPDKVLTNADLEKMVETTDEWIVSRTGIRERRIAREDQATSDLGVEAAGNALRNAGLEIGDIDLILVATNTPDTIFPSTACHIQRGLKGTPIPALDISAGCSGALYGMIVAESLILSGTAKRVLLVAPEMLSRVTNWADRSTCVLFGDGAGAFVLEESTDCVRDALPLLGGRREPRRPSIHTRRRVSACPHPRRRSPRTSSSFR